MVGNSTLGDESILIQSQAWRIVAGLLYVILFLLGTTGNLLVIYIFGWQKRGKRKTSELLLLSLGICDLATSAVLAPLQAFIAISADQNLALWYRIGCQVIPLILSVCITVSQALLILICYDRYRAIVTPLKDGVCNVLIRIAVISGTSLGIGLATPLIIQADAEVDNEICYDYSENGTLIISQAAVFVTRDILSFVVMAYFIRKMLIALRNSAAFRKTLSTQASVKKASDFQRAKRILYAVLVLFVILIWPADFCMLGIFLYYNGKEYTKEGMGFIVVFMSLVMLLQTVNSTVNVFIYSAIHPDFKKFLKQVKTAIFPKPRSDKEDDTTQGTINVSFSQSKSDLE